MTWGDDVVAWLASDDGWRVLSGAIIPAVAILIAGIVAAIIGRGSTRRLITLHQQDALTAAMSGFALAGRKASQWHDLGSIERSQIEHLAAESETRIRLLPIAGSVLAANWATHQLESMKHDSTGFRFQAQQTLAEYRDHLIAWSEKPRLAKELFGADLERWSIKGVDGHGDYANASALTGWQPEPNESASVSASHATAESPLTPEPPSAVAAATANMPLIIAHPRPESSLRERVNPDNG